MVKVFSDTVRLGSGRGYQVDKDNFYKAFHRAASNCEKGFRKGVKMREYRIGERDIYVSIVPINNHDNYEDIGEFSNDSIIYKNGAVKISPIDNYYNTIDLVKILEGCSKHSIKDYVEGNFVEYPSVWFSDDDFVELNESLRISKSKMLDKIKAVLKKGYSSVGLPCLNTEEIINICYYDEEIYHWENCGVCNESPNKGIYLSDYNYSKEFLPRSTVCMNCLVEFMSKHLEVSESRAESIIISRDL